MHTISTTISTIDRAKDKKTYDVAIIGGGLVGLATAYALWKKHPNKRVLLIEKEQQVAQHQSTHNSGVIHSGIYYPPGSAKAQNCVLGYQRLLSFCDQYGVDYRLCGKLIVATTRQQMASLGGLQARGAANGLLGIAALSSGALREREPLVRGIGGLWVPQTGIVNFGYVAKRLAAVLEAEAGLVLRCGTELIGASSVHGDTVLETTGGAYAAKWVINCAGLHNDTVAGLLGNRLPLRVIPFRGMYYRMVGAKAEQVRGLMYPVPDSRFPFLGVHITRHMTPTGSTEVFIGPNAVLGFAKEAYKGGYVWRDMRNMLSFAGFYRMGVRHWRYGLKEMARASSAALFLRAARDLVPSLTLADLGTSFVGVRAQACDLSGNLVDDFCLVRDRQIVHVRNAPSPAATACFAIREKVVSLLEDA